MNFCDDCNFLLYPVEDKRDKSLVYKCEVCQVEKVDIEGENNNFIVYKNEIQLKKEKKRIDPSIRNDPTYPRTNTVTCRKCGMNECIYFIDTHESSIGMNLVFVCCNKNCDGYWIQEEERN